MSDVLAINDKSIRDEILKFNAQTFPDVIEFIEDKEGNFITSIENGFNPAYTKYQTLIKEMEKGTVIPYKGEKTSLEVSK